MSENVIKDGDEIHLFEIQTKIQNIAVYEDVLTYAPAKLSGRKWKEVVDIYKMLDIKYVFLMFGYKLPLNISRALKIYITDKQFTDAIW